MTGSPNRNPEPSPRQPRSLPLRSRENRENLPYYLTQVIIKKSRVSIADAMEDQFLGHLEIPAIFK